MKIPSLKKFLDIKDPRDYLGPAKVEEIDRDNLGPKEVFLSWEKETSFAEKSPISKRFTRPVIIIGVVIGLLLLIMQEFFIILMVGSLIFFVQAIGKITPEMVKYEINSHGIKIGDDLYYWDKLRRFFFIKREGADVLVVDTVLGIPGRLYIDFNDNEKQKLMDILNKYLHFIESEPRTFLDNAYDRVVQKFSFQEDDEEGEGGSEFSNSEDIQHD